MSARNWALLAICMLPGVAAATEPVSFGDWQVGLTDDKTAVYAGTINDSGSVLAESCATDQDSCYWILTTDSVCRESAEYPVLINSDQSAASAVVTCLGATGTKGNYRYRFNDWESLEAVILKARKVGFAFPLQQDQFTVVRFSLDGVAKASQLAERLALEARKANSGSTRNVTL